MVEEKIVENKSLIILQKFNLSIIKPTHILSLFIDKLWSSGEVDAGCFDVVAVEVHHSFVEVVGILLDKYSKRSFWFILSIFHLFQNLRKIVSISLAALFQALNNLVVKCDLRIGFNIQHQLQILRDIQNIFQHKIALCFVEKNIKIIGKVVYIWIDTVSFVILSEAEKEVACPYMPFWGSGSEIREGVYVSKSVHFFVY